MARSKTYKTVTTKRSIPQRVKSALQALIDQEQTGYGQYKVQLQAGQPVQISKDFIAIAIEGYTSNPWIYKGFRIIIESASDITIKVTKETQVDHSQDVAASENSGKPVKMGHKQDDLATQPKTKWVDVDDHQLTKILHRPNEDQSWVELQETVLLHLLIAGNAFIFRAKPLYNLTCLRPDLVKPVPDDKGHIASYEYTIDEAKGTTVPYQKDEILHLMLIDPINALDGISPAKAAAMSINLNNTARFWNFQKLHNTVGLGGIFFGDEPLTENQTTQVESKIDTYKGPTQAASYALLDGVKSYQELSLSPKEMDWFNIMELSSHEVSMAIGVPKELLWGEATYENLDQAMRQLYTRTVLPLLGKLVDGLSHWFEPIYPGYRFELDTEEIVVLQEDIGKKAAWILPLAVNRIILVNEAREKMGWEPLEGCDIFLEPTGLQPVNIDGSLLDGGSTGATPPTPDMIPLPPGSSPGLDVLGPPGNGSSPPNPADVPVAGLMATLEAIKQKMHDN
jgi:HK97 family phage portal protein